jgi:hypothetical protein
LSLSKNKFSSLTISPVRFETYPMKSHLLLFLCVLLAVMLGLLVGPRVADSDQVKFCVANVDLPGPFGISMNCDSSEFMLLANNPSRLLENNSRTARPAMILAASGLVTVLSPLIPKGSAVLNEANVANPNRTTSAFEKNGAAYVAYLILNMILLCSAYIFMRYMMVQGKRNKSASEESSSGLTATVVGFGLLLISNDIVKAFAWSPHTQMFNILVPVLCIWILWMSWNRSLVEHRWAFMFALAIGFGIAAYPSFLLCLICMLAPWLLRQALGGMQVFALLRAAVLTSTALLPYILWYVVVKIKTGSFYVHETTKYNQVIWIFEALSEGFFKFVMVWFSNALNLVEMALPHLLFTAVAIAWTLIMRGLKKKEILYVSKEARVAIGYCVMVAMLLLIFFATVGYIIPRLAIPMVPPFIVAGGIFAVSSLRNMSSKDGKILGYGYFTIGVVAAFITVIKEGPWS